MKQVTFGEWVIDVDVETTKEYYQNHPIENNGQITRNFLAFCNMLTEEERSFFDLMGIDIRSVEFVDDFAVQGEHKTILTPFRCFISGIFIKKAEMPAFSFDEWQEKMDEGYQFPDNNIHVGRFQLQFNGGDENGNCAPDKPENFPAPAIQIGVVVYVPWLLKEKCNVWHGYQLKPWQLIKKSENKKFQKTYSQNAIEAKKSNLIYMFESHQIIYTKMTKAQIKNCCKKWFINIVPAEKQKKARKHCFSTSKYNNFLWHAFSYEDTPCVSEENARDQFDKQEKSEAVLFLNSEDIGYLLKNATHMTSVDFDDFDDIIIADPQYTWTYVHTHELDCGPYFYKK